MKIALLGAAGGEVTGSAYLLQTAAATVIIDCGLFQGSQKLENSNRLPTTAAMQQLKAVVITHAHLDHTGRLPLLTDCIQRRFGLRSEMPAYREVIEC